MSRPILDVSEAHQAFEALTSADLLRLERAGRIYAMGLNCDAGDLLSDAICQTLEGVRNCPREMPLASFLIGVMRSRAWALRQKATSRLQLVSIDAEDAEGRPLVAPASPERNAEEWILAKEDVEARISALEQLFADDEEAMLMMWADLDETPKEEIMAMNDLDATGYATIRRRMRRKINAAFPTGWGR
ncbi:MAG: hypothetical protein ACK4SZ_17330 [Allosphingosinicella sp.]|uniref:hypothetical protein n=1 Tax=Allosphingosinicella sp. TaxID=2823234 RepID=UPI00394E2B9A